jgi:oligopeptidase B
MKCPGSASYRFAAAVLVPWWALLVGCLPQTGAPTAIAPPVAEFRPHVVDIQGRKRSDPWYWLRDDTRSDADVLAYLNAENAYLDAALSRTRPLQAQLLAEMSARIDPEDTGVPWREGGYWYLERFRTGQEFPVITRRPMVPHAPESVILDANERAATGGFYALGDWVVSPDGQRLAFTEDRTGRELHDLSVRDLRSGALLPDRITGIGAEIAWANDNRTLYYLFLDDVLRPYQVRRHVLGTPVESDAIVYEEKDIIFNVSLHRSRDGNFIVMQMLSTLSTETRLIDANTAASVSHAFLPREPDHEYLVDLDDAEAFVLSNRNAPNFKIMRTTLADAADPARWQEVLPERKDVALFDMQVFRDFIAVNEVHAGTLKLRILGRDGKSDFYVQGRDAAYAATLDNNPEVNSETVRYQYTSLATPPEVHVLRPRFGEDQLMKQEFAGADFLPGKLRTEQISIAARDGTRVPVTLLYAAGMKPDGRNALYLHGYGAYGSVFDPEFTREILSLVDRGFVYAVAHIRGGGDLGRAWYEDGRVFNKKHTFTDFLDVARGLVRLGWAAPDRVVGYGRSAGGLLIGAVANENPNPFAVLVTEVPFVDVVTTMADETIPLTSYEWDEWGDPRIAEEYNYMLSYSPYDQVKAQHYPQMLVTAGLWDARVQYWEPAKWVAKLRATKTGDSKLYFSVDMGAGHAGLKGRYLRLKETAMEYAFVLETLGMTR